MLLLGRVKLDFSKAKQPQEFNNNDNSIYGLYEKKITFPFEVDYARVNGTSMYPTFNTDSLLIGKVPETEEEIYPGAIVCYNQPEENTICHRIIKESADEKGKCWILKGDNNYYSDKYKPRFEEIEMVVIGTLY